MIRGIIYIDIGQDFKPGDPPPSGYCDWHDWAEVQMAAGLEQRKCWCCGKWRFPQEVCHGPEPPDLDAGAFTVDDVLSGKVKLTGKLGAKVERIIERHKRKAGE